MPETLRTLSITEAEETAFVEIIRYFNDMGLPDNINSEDYDSLTNKVFEQITTRFHQEISRLDFITH